jgi:hypothetical protein
MSMANAAHADPKTGTIRFLNQLPLDQRPQHPIDLHTLNPEQPLKIGGGHALAPLQFHQELLLLARPRTPLRRLSRNSVS